MENGYKCIWAVVNNGFSEEAMEAAKACGAMGGTILHGRGTASKEAEKMFNISVQQVHTKSGKVDAILKGLFHAVGSSTPAQGIVFALPVDQTAGLGRTKE